MEKWTNQTIADVEKVFDRLVDLFEQELFYLELGYMPSRKNMDAIMNLVQVIDLYQNAELTPGEVWRLYSLYG